MKDLDQQWAWSQVEAAADGSLGYRDRQRMRDAIAADPALRKAIEDARRIRAALAGSASHTPVPPGLRERLLRIPEGAPRLPARRWPIGAVASAVAAAAVIGIAIGVGLRPTREPSAEQLQAAAELQTAMTYLRRTATVAETEVMTAVGSGLRDAVGVSRDAALDNERESNNGG
jgi:hypothetical protein